MSFRRFQNPSAQSGTRSESGTTVFATPSNPPPAHWEASLEGSAACWPFSRAGKPRTNLNRTTDMSEPRTTSAYGTTLLTFLAGAAVGAVVVALTTPKTGPELRGDLKDLTLRAKRRAGELAEDASDTWDDLKGRTALAAADLKRGMADAANDLRG